MTSDTDLSPDSQDDLPEPPMEGPGLFGDPSPPAPPAAAAPVAAPAAVVAPAPVVPAEPSQPYRVLARKYRPQDFNDLIGQEALVRTLRNAFAQNRVAHAFMLTGVRGVGKTTTARIIARALNCIGPNGTGGPTADPCGVCPECRAILADRHPDVMELDAASNNGVENVREIREAVRFRPTQGRFKVYILDEVHMLSGAAFNALLKTLEEPPPAVKFLFATTEIRKVPATILSRCQRFDLKRVPQEVLRAHFARIAEKEGASVEPEALAMIARAADGSVRDGLSLLDQAIAMPEEGGGVTAEAVRDMLGLADRALVMDLMEAAMRGDLPAVLAAMDRAHERGADPGVVLADMAELTHLLTRFRAVPGLRNDPSIPEAERVRGGALAETLTIPVLGRAWQVLLKGIGEVAESPDRRAAAEMVLIRLAHLAEMPTPGDIVRRLSGAAPVPRGGPGGPAPSGGTGGGGAMAEAVAGASVAGASVAGASLSGPSMSGPGAGGLRAIAGGAAVRALVAPEVAPVAAVQPETEVAPAPMPATFREVAALASGRKPMLHAHLVHSVHLVRFEMRAEGGRIELRTRPDAPRDLAGQLTALLQEVTGARWTVSLSNAEGEPTLAEQGRTAAVARLEVARSHPLVLAVMDAFPGAQIREVRDASLDAYGLPPPEVTGDGEPVGEDDIGFAPLDDDFGFAPLDAEPAGMDRP
ncbi:DNA polymerase-3 subunit gamma/tau [Roseomonas rosea]|uniref:DNA polymerase III subunit gamma/tau n=1 Tax=Muricoccus roseus TaxID=198092 RepID=A0A1M6RTV0_9PROT|nr:DNA polymerase III subunit gamma/tau [Roseomonas rosea]SHK35932.1 DNA polymerase-3 subunit gamma/tau [Roseomonas rosea]